MTHVVTAFLRDRGRLLLVRRSDAVGTYQGLWGGVSGYVEGDPADALDDARRELREEVGVTDATLVRAGSTVTIVDGDREWTVHPFLFDAVDESIETNEELTATEWVHAPAMRTRETVPGLWQAYEAVAPSVETVRGDQRHGSAYVSVRALEVLRDRGVLADDWADVAAVARNLREARPSMAALANRVNRVLSDASDADRTPEAVSERAATAVDDAVRADETAARNAAELLSETEAETVVTLSRSGTVTAALAEVPEVVVAESRPACEGVAVAEELADAGTTVTLVTDAAMGYALAERDVDAAVVGADTLFSDGSVANKVGTRLLALAAARDGVPLYVVTARDKVSPNDDFHPEFGERDALYEGESGLDVLNPTFDRTPADLLTGVVTEDGVLDSAAVAAVADEHRRFAEWDE
ncbi:Translation initiation factor 2B subunit, eIF-2B alpha/beta/delta family [Halogranum gelatinilyticum]|uniref:Translation initiation factor 2B subunit, eIF-2B alpha/beta/delta family n=1 Tax=Halogranum gelatinilyticum TaxID=660521 RepID=A0A1G9XXD1_9EURY|nr:NUDIX domain-containing protein [Halogranum gelatinilyticum]SDN00923.1 Translation initiation factor 2B subunit, eIF-2B alpha/beta/delta family [Halogranum gelatinilyticum]